MPRPRRSLLFVPTANPRALEKSAGLDADGLIFDLEDSVLPSERPAARDNLRRHLDAIAGASRRPEIVVRISGFSGRDGEDDLAMLDGPVRQGVVDAVLVPKTQSPGDLASVAAALPGVALWAMIETPMGILAAEAIAGALASLAAAAPGAGALVAGTNDIVLATGVRMSPGRPQLVPWLAAIVLAAKAHGLAVIDGVYNDFFDAGGLAAECAAGRAMGFDGKTLIHPAQIDAANLAFAPAPDDIRRAQAIVEAFAQPEHARAGVIRLDGRMVERLHLLEAERLLALRDRIAVMTTRTDR